MTPNIKLDSELHITLTREVSDGNGGFKAIPVLNEDQEPIRVCRDVYSGKFYARIYARRPNGQDNNSIARAAKIDAASESGKLVHYSSPEPDMTGYYAEVAAYQIPASSPTTAAPAIAPVPTPAAAPAPAASATFDPFA